MRVMCRHAEDDFDAMIIANGMGAAGAEVFSVTFDRHSQPWGALAPHAHFIVWAKVKSDADIDAVDISIDEEQAKYRKAGRPKGY